MKEWTPEERLAFLFDEEPPFVAGQGWDYSDTNYIVLGMIIGIARYLEDGRGVYSSAVNANTRNDPRYNRVRLVQSA